MQSTGNSFWILIVSNWFFILCSLRRWTSSFYDAEKCFQCILQWRVMELITWEESDKHIQDKQHFYQGICHEEAGQHEETGVVSSSRLYWWMQKKKVLIFSRLIYIQRHIEKDYYNISPNCMAFSKCHFYKFFNSKLNHVIFQKYVSSNYPIYLHAPIYSIHVLW